MNIKQLLQNKWTWIILAFFVFLALIMPHYGYPADDRFWLTWVSSIQKLGLMKAYEDPTLNYLPLYPYILMVVGNILRHSATIFETLYSLKLVTLAFDLGIAALSYQVLRKLQIPRYRILFIILNLALIYDTVFWGQIDSIPTFFVLLSLWLAMNRKTAWSVLVFVIALNFKLQMLAFMPVIALIWLYEIWSHPGHWYNLIKMLGLGAAVEVIIISPFLLSNHVNTILNTLNTSVGLYPYLSLSAFNFWLLLKGPAGIFGYDFEKFIGPVTYRTTGMILFIAALCVILLPLLYRLRKKYSQAKPAVVNWLKPNTASVIFLSAGMSCLVFFFFNTEMHERYIIPALIFFALWAVIRNKFWSYLAYGLISLGAFMNVEKLLGYLPLDHLTFFWGSRPIAIVISAAMVIGLVHLYNHCRLKSVT